MFVRKTSVAETIFGGKGWEKEWKDLTPPPPPLPLDSQLLCGCLVPCFFSMTSFGDYRDEIIVGGWIDTWHTRADLYHSFGSIEILNSV